MKNVYDIRRENNLTYILPENDHLQSFTRFPETYKKTAIIIYLYYIDTLSVYYRYLDSIPADIDIYILSSREEVLEEVSGYLESFPERTVRYILKENRGRDVSALLVAGRDIAREYEYVCFLHDKKEHCEERKEDTQLWVENLWGNQIGSTAYIDGILELFERDEKLGILAPPEPIGRCFNTWYGYGWYHSFEITSALARKLQLRADIRLDKPPITFGTVLWFRSKALEKLLDAGWKYSDFDDKRLDDGGYLSYAVERIFAYVAQDAGFYTGTVMTASYAATQINFLQYATSCIFNEMEAFFPVNNLDDLECYKRNKSRILDFARKNKNVYLYGAGKMGRLCLALLRREHILPAGFLVSGDNGLSMAEGISVIRVDQLESIRDAAVIITVYDSSVQDEIMDMLEKKGCFCHIKLWDRQDARQQL